MADRVDGDGGNWYVANIDQEDARRIIWIAALHGVTERIEYGQVILMHETEFLSLLQTVCPRYFSFKMRRCSVV